MIKEFDASSSDKRDWKLLFTVNKIKKYTLIIWPVDLWEFWVLVLGNSPQKWFWWKVVCSNPHKNTPQTVTPVKLLTNIVNIPCNLKQIHTHTNTLNYEIVLNYWFLQWTSYTSDKVCLHYKPYFYKFFSIPFSWWKSVLRLE